MYFDPRLQAFVEPFKDSNSTAGISLTNGSGWVGYFIDRLRPEVGMGFYTLTNETCHVAISPADRWPGSPSVLATNYMTNIGRFGRAFRQMFLLLGTKEEMQAKAALLSNFTRVLGLPPRARGG